MHDEVWRYQYTTRARAWYARFGVGQGEGGGYLFDDLEIL